MADGSFVRELAERIANPRIDGGLIVTPPNWSVGDPAAYIKPGPTAESLKVYSLSAVRDYIVANRDALALGKLIVHVVSPQIVRLSGPLLERARNREAYVEATAQNLMDNFTGKWMAHDEFIIGLQTRFVANDDLRAVVRLFSNISHEAARTSQDDGISQTVTAKTGIALKAEIPVPNPIALIPFRTFREVEQPPSLFALRVNQTAQVGMFEADGGAWRIVAVEHIARWLRVNIPAESDIAVLA